MKTLLKFPYIMSILFWIVIIIASLQKDYNATSNFIVLWIIFLVLCGVYKLKDG